ncbi:hypothetical protein IHQ68_16730 [Chelatococcus sambhunathii]|uniref:Uncharacterized protein n=1 Tax=Chelatococcus sambhunathii TaxID=363953 RepID=A0ABU1DJF5_9HYPH|nr:hypothetical protein [Chelatococcus sambhunathii]MDR4308265.1 hypothetical protein [Chelatococcus sambhunathii]
MTHYGEHAEDCPVPLELLSALYRAGPNGVAAMTAGLTGSRKVALAVYCYGRAHFRELGLAIASTCDAAELASFAGVMGQVLCAQSRGRIHEFGRDGHAAGSGRRRITLAKSAA